ncbi:MAG: diguanylate cyclase [Oscillospiraceae bacterium]|nr:diguanylate cyclase [Oscillospiraceae bacterium]
MSDIKKEFTILISDDEKFNLDILASILSPFYNILIARNGTRTLELAKLNSPDLILLDVIMPDMNGFEVITKLKESDHTVNIPVIFITGLTDPDDEERGFFLGAVDYITKPFNKAIVKARVNTHIKIIDQMRTIEQIGLMDTLTKVSNRRGFDNRFDAEWGRSIRENSPLSFMIMDIDKFKNYNDTYGHHQGDNALRAFAETASQTSGRANDFFARWGGEEFVMLLPGTDIYGAAEVAEKLRKNIEEMTIPTEDGEITKVTVSIGVKSIIPTTGSSLSDFQAKADQALYRAKESGRNRVELCKD